MPGLRDRRGSTVRCGCAGRLHISGGGTGQRARRDPPRRRTSWSATSGLSGAEYAGIDGDARERGVAVIAAGNFSITAALATAAAVLVAPHLPHREIVDYASATKRDAPSGTARELAERIAAAGASADGPVPVAETVGAVEARGTSVDGVRVHSVRLPSFTVSTEVVFAMPGERLVIRHDAGESPAPYVAGTLAAIRALPGRVGLTRGLDRILLEGPR